MFVMNRIFVLTVTIFISLHLFSQKGINQNVKKESFFEKIKFGLKGGYDMNPLTADFSVMKDQTQTNGFQAGCFVKYGKIFYVQPEFYYTEYSPIINSTHQNYKLKGLVLPVLGGIKFLDIEILQLRVLAGPSIYYDFSGQDNPDNIKRLRFNFQVGAGIDIFDFVTADLRYGLLNGVYISDQISDFNPDTSVLNFTIGLKY